jgi:hypothetical protein
VIVILVGMFWHKMHWGMIWEEHPNGWLLERVNILWLLWIGVYVGIENMWYHLEGIS